MRDISNSTVQTRFPKRFKDKSQQRLYEHMRTNPPVRGGRALNDAFHYGATHPDQAAPPIYGVRRSLQYAAWRAGADFGAQSKDPTQ